MPKRVSRKPIHSNDTALHTLKKASRRVWRRYAEVDSFAASEGADHLEAGARYVRQRLAKDGMEVSFEVALAMIVQTSMQRMDWGTVNRETGETRY